MDAEDVAIERCRSHLVWEAWTDFGSVGAGRRAILTQIDNFRQGLGHLRVDPTSQEIGVFETTRSRDEKHTCVIAVRVQDTCAHSQPAYASMTCENP